MTCSLNYTLYSFIQIKVLVTKESALDTLKMHINLSFIMKPLRENFKSNLTYFPCGSATVFSRQYMYYLESNRYFYHSFKSPFVGPPFFKNGQTVKCSSVLDRGK